MMSFLKFVSFALVIIILFITYHFASDSPVTTEEIIRADEAEQINRSIDNFIKVIEENKTNYIARGAHSKGHACVKAYFDVLENIAPELQQGIFQTPGRRYKSWIRFSNGRSSMTGNHDADKDAHGMAIKLFNIYDESLMQPDDGPETQDFLMHDSPVFFTADLEDYNRFVESDDKILYFFDGINPFKWKLRELKHGLATLKEPPSSPLRTEYFSNTAYKLGADNIKFSTQSCMTPPEITGQDINDPDFLRKNMAEELQDSEACFEFRVQLQDPDKYMPIEDPSILWKESDSPFITVAKIIIPQQEFDSEQQQQFCENLSFAPWNALPEHRPIGQLNRIRKEVYAASSKYRHENNHMEPPASLDW
jgi:catalase